MIETLPALTPNPERGARVVARCHERLALRRRQIEAAERNERRRAALIERAIGAAFCLAYAAAMIAHAIRIFARA